MGTFEESIEAGLGLYPMDTAATTGCEDDAQLQDPDQMVFPQLSQCDQDRARLGSEVAVALIRLRLPEGSSEVAKVVAKRRITEQLVRGYRAPEFGRPVADNEFAVAMFNVDADAARERVQALVASIRAEPALADARPGIWAGVAPVNGSESREALRTARLACELACFQDSGHVEVIDL